MYLFTVSLICLLKESFPTSLILSPPHRLLALPLADRYIKGHPVTIKRAKKKVILPGDDGYVRSPLSDRDFDLASPDPTQPSMHMLVDDVMFKIFSLLPTKTLVKCEGGE